MGEGNVFSLFTGEGRWCLPPPPHQGTCPHPGQDGGYPKVPTPHQGTSTHPGQDGSGGTPRYLPPAKVPPPPIQARIVGRVPQGTYPPPTRSGWGRGYPKIPTLPRSRYLPPPPIPGIGQHMEYLIRCGRYASCVHAGGLSCYLYACGFL